MTILINGTRINFFDPTQGIRQGDPISLYIFILCMEVLSYIFILSMEVLSHISEAVFIKGWSIRISRCGPSLSYLVFADDLVLMSSIKWKNCNNIKFVLLNFCTWSGKNINHLKSKILYSKNCPLTIQQRVLSLFNIRSKPTFGKYLGFTMLNKRPSKADFQFIIDNLIEKLSGWKTKFLNIAGRTTLARSSLNSIPIHIMHYIKLPLDISKKIDRIQRNFIWGSTINQKSSTYWSGTP